MKCESINKSGPSMMFEYLRARCKLVKKSNICIGSVGENFVVACLVSFSSSMALFSVSAFQDSLLIGRLSGIYDS